MTIVSHETGEEMVKVQKITRGYNLSVANVNWLIDQAQKRTREAGNGKTISPNVVLDEILTQTRQTPPQPSPKGEGVKRKKVKR